MSQSKATWRGVVPPPIAPLTAAGWARALARGVPVLAVIALTMLGLGLARLFERPLGGAARPVSGRVVMIGARVVLWLFGLGLMRVGAPMRSHGAQVANHCSWMDIFVLNACVPAQFVAKDDVARWPIVSSVARAVGTLFIKRDPREAKRQQAQIEERLRAGQRLIFFPEGTSSDGLRVLPFKPTLFAAFCAPDLRATTMIQPVSLRYISKAEPSFYGFWGEMDFAPHFLKILGARHQGRVVVRFHPPLEITDRKPLAEAAESAVRTGFDA